MQHHEDTDRPSEVDRNHRRDENEDPLAGVGVSSERTRFLHGKKTRAWGRCTGWGIGGLVEGLAVLGC